MENNFMAMTTTAPKSKIEEWHIDSLAKRVEAIHVIKCIRSKSGVISEGYIGFDKALTKDGVPLIIFGKLEDATIFDVVEANVILKYMLKSYQGNYESDYGYDEDCEQDYEDYSDNSYDFVTYSVESFTPFKFAMDLYIHRAEYIYKAFNLFWK